LNSEFITDDPLIWMVMQYENKLFSENN